MDKKRIYSLVFSILLTIISAVFVGWIFSNSIQNGTESSERSSEVVEVILEYFPDIDVRVDSNTEVDRKTALETLIRKCAHFAEFTALGILLFQCIWQHYTTWAKSKIKLRLVYLLAVFIGLITALSDETIQLFSAGRSSQVTDVWIDFSGVLLGGLMLLIVHAIIRKKQRNIFLE